MTDTFPEATRAVVVETGPVHSVDWGAIAAGVFFALAVSSVFLAFGSAVGLSLTSFQTVQSTPVIGAFIAAGLWLLWVQISSFVGGAYIAGRLRRRNGETKAHEVEMRDGAHGLIVWAVNIVIGAALAALISLAGASTSIGTASNSASFDYYADKLMRRDVVADTTATSDPHDNAPIGRILARNIAAGALDEADRTYVVREVSSRTGLAEPEAQKRLDDTLTTLKAQAEKARRFAVLLGFMVAASFVVSGIAAWWAAAAGGKHRNESIDHSRHWRWK